MCGARIFAQLCAAKVVNRYTYLKEKRAALEIWARQVMTLMARDQRAA